MNKDNKATDVDVKSLGLMISHETNLMFLIARVLDTIMADLERQMAKVKRSYCIRGEVKKRLNEYIHFIEQAGAHFSNFVEPHILNSVNEDWEQYERTRRYANELIRVLMLYYETCSKNDNNHVRVFELFEELLNSSDTNIGAFRVEDVNRFDLGCKKSNE